MEKIMKFEWTKQNKTMDQLEVLGTTNSHYVVERFFKVDDAKDLTKEQIEEVLVYSESDEIDGFLGMCLRNVINYWQMENDNYDIM